MEMIIKFPQGALNCSGDNNAGLKKCVRQWGRKSMLIKSRESRPGIAIKAKTPRLNP